MRIPGSVLHKAERNGYAITEHEYNQDSFSLSFRNFHFPAEITLINTEKINWVRLETVLSGELRIKNPDGKVTQLLPGQYHLTDTPIFQTQFSKAQTCTYFSAYYSSEFLSMLGLPITVTPITPRPLPMAKQELIYEFLDNPFDNDSYLVILVQAIKYVICYRKITSLVMRNK